MNRNRYDADGGPKEALRNIEVTLDNLLTDEEKSRINWHPEQNIHLAVMRIISELHKRKAAGEPPIPGHPVWCAIHAGHFCSCIYVPKGLGGQAE